VRAEVVTALQAAGLDPDDTKRAVSIALEEDFRYGPDVTSVATVEGTSITAEVVAREPGVLSGIPVALAVLDALDPLDPAETPVIFGAIATKITGVSPSALRSEVLRADGERISPGDVILRVSGPATLILGAERTILNFLTHLSGIATVTRQWADAVQGTGAVIRDTRKTLPGLRALQKYAVRCGGGQNHRMGLGDAVLIKDNHVAAAGGVAAAIRAVQAAQPTVDVTLTVIEDGGCDIDRLGRMPLEVECDTLAQVRESLEAGARLILLDNMNVSTMRGAVEIARKHSEGIRLEASGGLRLENAREVASTGVDYLAVGALTHSSPALDLGVDVRHDACRTRSIR
jgi:nicotinate-nucleotide pyrophosphorylase (carboxylating)